RRNGRIVAQQRYSRDAGRMQQAVQQASAGMRGADAIFIPDRVEGLRAIVPMITAAGIDTRRAQLLGTGAWDDSQVFANPALQGGWYATVDPAGFRSFANRYRAKYGQEPVRTATLAYDAVALVAALAKTQGPQRFAPETLTSASGFTGIDGLFRFRPEGPSQRGLAVMRVTPSGGQIIGQPPKAFAPGS
ncbi:MAG TPA: ABC transporter substrate-binding protein, partial [Xanthobacteraceae bacterium]|nr:ABC transporter substrate-binding protein [Xanthobacteraceae bacterium]